jgi:hypothetical protein
MHEDILLTLAEIAITLAALSGVAGILGARSSQTKVAAFEILLLRNVALIGMAVAVFGILPLTFRGSAINDVVSLRLCSALVVVCWLVGYGLFLRRAVPALRSGEFAAGVFLVGLAFNVVGAALMLWNVASPSSASAQRYVLALMCALALAGINFIITALRLDPAA